MWMIQIRPFPRLRPSLVVLVITVTITRLLKKYDVNTSISGPSGRRRQVPRRPSPVKHCMLHTVPFRHVSMMAIVIVGMDKMNPIRPPALMSWSHNESLIAKMILIKKTHQITTRTTTSITQIPWEESVHEFVAIDRPTTTTAIHWTRRRTPCLLPLLVLRRL